MGRRGRRLVFLLLLGGPSIAHSQATIAGRVVRIQAGDTLPVSGTTVVLHRIAAASQGPVDSLRTAPTGAFRFRRSPDTSAFYLVSANYAGIEYFSPPVGREDLDQGPVTLTVSDTSSTVPVRVAARYLVLRAPDPDGSRRVLDLLVLENRSDLTRIGPDTLSPSWRGRIPSGVANASAGQAEVSGEAIETRGDTLLVYAPLAPGEKQVTVDYILPPGADLVLPFPDDSVAANVLVQEERARVINPGMVLADSQEIEGTVFHRWIGVPPRGTTIRVSFGPAPGEVPRWVLPALVALAGAALLVVTLRRSRRRAAAPAASLDELTTRIAELVARYEGREAEVPPGEWQEYLHRRRELEAAAADRLAGTRPST